MTRRVPRPETGSETGGRTEGRAEYFTQWGALHGGLDVERRGGLVRWWLAGVYAAAQPLTRLGVGPGTLTWLAVVVAAGVPALCAAGGGWVFAAAVVAALSGWLDNLDGAVAILSGRVTRWGYLVDSLGDRCADAAYLLAFWLAGARPGVCVGAGAALALLEYTRARAGNAGAGEITVVTVGERPARVIVTAAFLLAGAVTGRPAGWALAGAAATLVVATVGWVQLLLALRGVLSGRADQPGHDA